MDIVQDYHLLSLVHDKLIADIIPAKVTFVNINRSYIIAH